MTSPENIAPEPTPPAAPAIARKPRLVALKVWLTVLFLYPAFDLIYPPAYVLAAHQSLPPRYIVMGVCGLLLVGAVVMAWAETRRWTVCAIVFGLLALGVETAGPLFALLGGVFVAVLLHAKASAKKARP